MQGRGPWLSPRLLHPSGALVVSSHVTIHDLFTLSGEPGRKQQRQRRVRKKGRLVSAVTVIVHLKLTHTRRIFSEVFQLCVRSLIKAIGDTIHTICDEFRGILCVC